MRNKLKPSNLPKDEPLLLTASKGFLAVLGFVLIGSKFRFVARGSSEVRCLVSHKFGAHLVVGRFVHVAVLPGRALGDDIGVGHISLEISVGITHCLTVMIVG